MVGGQKTLKIRPNWTGKGGEGCECADKQNGRKCDCHSNNGQQQQFLMMEEPKRRAGTMIGGTSTEGTTGKIGWGDQLKGAKILDYYSVFGLDGIKGEVYQ